MATAGGLHVADIPGLTAERVFGRSRVVGTDLEISGWCRATQLVVDFPGVRLGVDADADVPWLRSVRGQCAALTLEIDGARLSVAVSAAARALDWVEEVRVDLLDDELRVVIQLTGKTAATVSARVGVVVEGATLVLVPFEYLALGAAPAPSAATFAVCAAALLASPELSPLIRAVERVGDCVRIEPARAGLAAAFCRAGWKLPGTELIEIGEVRIAPGRALVSASGSRGGRAATSRAARQAFAAWAERLDEPALTAALEARDESSLEAVALARVEASALARAIVLEAQVRDDPDAAVSVANERLSEVAGDAAALAALVSASVTRGDSEALVRACRALVEALGRAGRQDDQILVILFAASVLAPTAPTTASKWIDAALKLAPRDAGALRMRVKLARQLGDVDAYEDGLARLLALARARSVKARLHRELGRVARDHRRDPVRAWRHFADAASLVPDDALSWVLCGQAQAEAGAPVEAVQSLRSGLRVARTDDELVGPTAALTAAKLWADSLGDAAAAHRELRAAIERWPGSVALLDALDALDAGLPLPAAAHLPTTAAHVAVGASAQRGVASATPPTATEPAPFPAARAPDAQPAPGSASNEARGVARARALARVASARDAGDERGLASALADAASLEPDAGARAALLAELGELLYYELEEEERATQYLEEAARLDPT
ncbi:MAG: hypothetical protein H6699_10035, partial [Myxococcales bacterium]|nr:hypothetical protein [Myxococcales bacterium]